MWIISPDNLKHSMSLFMLLKLSLFCALESSGIVIKATSCHIEAGSNSKLKGKPQQVKVCVGFHLTVSPIKSEGAVDRICRVLLSLLSSP